MNLKRVKTGTVLWWNNGANEPKQVVFDHVDSHSAIVDVKPGQFTSVAKSDLYTTKRASERAVAKQKVASLTHKINNLLKERSKLNESLVELRGFRSIWRMRG